MSDIRPRSLAEILDAAFEIYRRHFAPFFTVALIGALPSAAMWSVFASLGDTFNPYSWQFGTDPFAGVTAPMALIVIVAVLVGFLTYGAYTKLASDAYTGNPVDMGRALSLAWKRLPALIGVSIVAWFMLFIGTLITFIPGFLIWSMAFGFFNNPVLSGVTSIIGVFLFLIPGAIIAAWLFGVYAALLIENKPVFASISRSRFLAQGFVKRIILLYILVAIIAFVLQSALVILPIVLSSATGLIVAMILSGVFSALLTPYIFIVFTVLYHDLWLRKEGVSVTPSPETAVAPAI